MLRNNTLLKSIAVLASSLLLGVILFWSLLGTVWTQVDFQVLDVMFRYAVRTHHAGQPSPQIIYLSLTDETYTYWGHDILDREYLSRVNTALAELRPQAVAYDMIFARPRNPAADARFAESLSTLGCAYLPTAFDFSDQARSLQKQAGIAYNRLQTDYLKQPVEHGEPEPVYATKALLQWDVFAEVAYHSGHINAWVDSDGIHRHHIMLVKVDAAYFPTLSLAMFLDYVGMSLDDVVVTWGHEIRIPATKARYLMEDVVIPIDEQGRAFIPFPQVWGKDFDNLAAHNFLEYAQTPDLQGNLAQLFENRFVFVGDLSQGATDVGQTPLEDRVPLIAIHTALLHGLLTNTFYAKWSFGSVIALICLITLAIACASLPKAAWILHVTGIVILLGLIGLTWWQFLNFVLFPVATVGGSFLVIFLGVVVGLEIAISRQQAIIHHAFAKFVPETVVTELTLHPEKLTLGGEERVVSILFSDIEGFTTIAEQLPPQQLVQLLNHYLTEMTTIILQEGGTIDKYEGDAIMAEFGAPLPVENHADMAVAAALKQQRRLRELRQEWAERGLPELHCRIGIHTGPVIIGNMGSDQVFDYTVIGDAANLAARLERVNKRYNTRLMISASTHHALSPHRFLTRTLDFIKVKGKSEPVMVFEVYGEAGDNPEAADLAYYQNYQSGIDAYFARDFTQALQKLNLALNARPNDVATRWLISRIVNLDPDALPEDWDGSVELMSK